MLAAATPQNPPPRIRLWKGISFGPITSIDGLGMMFRPPGIATSRSRRKPICAETHHPPSSLGRIAMREHGHRLHPLKNSRRPIKT